MTTETLTELFTRHGSDKATAHSYGPVYDELLAPMREQVRYLLEIGVGSGASLKAWRDYFPHALIFGMDSTDKTGLFEDRIFPFVGNQAVAGELLRVPGELGIQFDVIVDDGSHDVGHQQRGVFWLWPYLRPGGLYFVEDVLEAGHLPHFACFQNATLLDFVAKGSGFRCDRLVVLRKDR